RYDLGYPVYHIIQDDNENYWLCTLGLGVIFFDGNTFGKLKYLRSQSDNAYHHDHFRAALKLESGEILIAGESAFLRISADNVIQYHYPYYENRNNLILAFATQNTDLFVGTFGNGLIKMDRDFEVKQHYKIPCYSHKSELMSQTTCNKIGRLEAADSSLIIYTIHNGIWALNESEIKLYSKGRSIGMINDTMLVSVPGGITDQYGNSYDFEPGTIITQFDDEMFFKNNDDFGIVKKLPYSIITEQEDKVHEILSIDPMILGLEKSVVQVREETAKTIINHSGQLDISLEKMNDYLMLFSTQYGVNIYDENLDRITAPFLTKIHDFGLWNIYDMKWDSVNERLWVATYTDVGYMDVELDSFFVVLKNDYKGNSGLCLYDGFILSFGSDTSFLFNVSTCALVKKIFVPGGVANYIQFNDKLLGHTSSQVFVQNLDGSKQTIYHSTNIDQVISKNESIYIITRQKSIQECKLVDDSLTIVHNYDLCEYIDCHEVRDLKIRDKDFLIAYKNKVLRWKQNNDQEEHPVAYLRKVLIKTNGEYTNVDESVLINNQLILSHSDNYIEFHYGLINPIGLRGYEINYKLTGKDLKHKWRVTSDNNVIYQDLSPGDYEFKIKTCRYDNTCANQLEFAFTVLPPFWQTWWFRTLLVLLASIIVWSYIKYRERSLKREQQALEQKVKERTKEVIEQKEEIEKQKSNLELQNEKIEHQNLEIKQSIHYALNIQKTVLPESQLVDFLIPKNFIYYKPRDIVSGDFYAVEDISRDKVMFAAIDCTGHGVPGAFVSIVGNNAIKRVLREEQFQNASEFLQLMDVAVRENLKQNEETSSIKDGMDLSMCFYDKKSKVIDFSGANNPIYVVRHKDHPTVPHDKITGGEQHILYEIKGDKQPIGGWDHEPIKKFTNHRIELLEDDTVYVITDGFPDQFGGPKNKKYKYRVLKELLVSFSDKGLSMKDQLAILDKELIAWKGDLEQTDDICIIGVKVI
ncbi:MAG: SpoIIE family protein phosphatase, partial [Flavobacteriales bacterium]|nr:SpoIIE family protein phosphatase [Flavobacteriales bacterium]